MGLLDDMTFTVTVSYPSGLDEDGEPFPDSPPIEVEGCLVGVSEGYPPADWVANDRRPLVAGRAHLYGPPGTAGVFRNGATVHIPPGGLIEGPWRVIGPGADYGTGVLVFLSYTEEK